MTAFQSTRRPGLAETLVMTLAIFLLTAGLPTEWFFVATKGEAITGGGLFVSLLFLAIAGSLALNMSGRWPELLALLAREPLLILFALWVFLSTAWSHDPTLSIRRAIAMVVAGYFGTHLVTRFTQFEIMRILALAFSAVVFLNVFWLVVMTQYSGPAYQPDVTAELGFDDRLTGMFQTPNLMGRMMAVSILTLFAAFRLDPRRRVLYVPALAAAMLSLALSQSKTSLVVSTMTALMLVVFLVFRARRTLFGAVFVSVVMGAAMTIVLVFTNLGFITDSLDRDVTLSGRIPLWETLVPRVLERPIIGYGYSGFWNGWGSPAHGVWNENYWLPSHGHNQFIDLALMLGFVGLAIFCALFFRTLIRATRHVRDVSGVFGVWPLAFVCYFLLNMITESGFIARDITWCLFVASVVLVSNRARSVTRAGRIGGPTSAPALMASVDNG